MLKKQIMLLFISTMILVSCGGGEKDKESSEDAPSEEVIECFYEFNPGLTTINWTAFKFTDRTGVKGKFERISVSNTERSNDPYTTLSSISFSIPVEGINTENPDRDMKIKEHFFGSMAETENIEGKIVSWNLESGEAILLLRMNGVEKEISAEILMEDETATLTAMIDVNSFNAGEALNKLNAVCEELHTGLDGVSKLWSEVEIEVVTTLTKDCN